MGTIRYVISTHFHVMKIHFAEFDAVLITAIHGNDTRSTQAEVML